MKIALPLLALVLLAGCARDEGTYPSLAPRGAERQGFEEPAVAPPPPMVADPVLDAQVAASGARLDAVVKGFDADAARAKKAASAGGARIVGNDAWIAAQGALAALDDWRAQAGGLASELDTAARERADAVGTPYPALEALRARAEAEAVRESTTIAAIGATLPTP